ncbi:hypothetical protein PINS_up008265 [Pythium insidiosum]|nr:hypothetical protein PINS_up008265 [Pythium insidiosum]
MSTPSPPVPMDDASVETAAASAVNSESEVTAAASAASTGKKRGRKPAKFWVSLTTIDEPYKQRAAPCRHCGTTVKYHKKWEQAKGHLLKCTPFLHEMRALAPSDRPDWFRLEVDKRRRATASRFPFDAPQELSLPSTALSTAAPLAVADTDAAATGDGAWRSELLALLAALSATSTHLAADREVSTLVKRLRSSPTSISTQPPTVENGDDGLLPTMDQLVAHVRSAVEQRLTRHDRNGCALLVTASDAVLAFWIAAGEQLFLWNAVEKTDNSGVIVAEIRAVVTGVPAAVTSCVLDLEHALGESVLKQLTTTELDSLRFTQLAPHRVLEALVADVLQSPEARDLVVTALKCHDVLSLAAKSPSMAPRNPPRGTRCVVSGLRAINVWDALDSVVGLAKIVSEEGDDGQDGLLRDIRQRFPSEDVLSNVNELLADPSFRENLDLSLAVLAPFREFVDRVLQHDAAEIVPAFGTLHTKMKELASTKSEAISTTVLRLVDTYKPQLLAPAFKVAHYLDPVHAAAMLDQADNLVAEHLLLSSHTLSGGSKEELYMQLTAFQIAVDALQTAATDKPSSGDTVAETRAFSFKMLENRKKSAAQYWLTDGRQWPQLQRLALAVYQVPCIASVPHDVLERHCPHYNGGDAMKKWRASLNVAFLGVNAAVLGVDTVLETIATKDRVTEVTIV